VNILQLHGIWKNIFIVSLFTTITSTYSAYGQVTRLDSIVVEVTGNEFNWNFRYPGEDGIFGTIDDRHSVQDLFLPDNTPVTLKLSSKDYVYSFALPDLDMEEIAVPDLSFEMQFNTGKEQTMPLMGDQLCGYIHPTLIGKVYIRNQSHGFYTWANGS
jgi:cytochrome c oxidase subunit 2